jgi:hypothetical protein
MDAIEYVKRKQKLVYTTRVVKNGQMFAIVQGKEIPEEDFRRENKLPVRLHVKENACKKLNYLDA